MSTSHDADKELPPVKPPSGKFIAQLFLVPLLIVTAAMGSIGFVTWLVGGFYTPENFLKDLRNPNAEVRWRRASDLAQVLERDDNLASNPTFALDLEELLRQSLRDSEQSERAWAERSRKKPAQTDVEIDKSLADERAFIQYLVACLGHFHLPVGVPLLNEIALKEDGTDPETAALRRRLAILALARLGENVKKIQRFSTAQRHSVVHALENEQAIAGTVGRSPKRDLKTLAAARLTCDYVKSLSPDGGGQALDVDKTLTRCATSQDPILRKFATFALTFWEGTPEENARMEEALVTLSRDDGHGAKGAEAAIRGREIRYPAARALSRRGSDKIDQRVLRVLGEMLDEDFQASAFRMKLKDGREVPDGELVMSNVAGALKSVVELHHKKPNVDLSELFPAVEKLTQSANPDLRTQAERTLIDLGRK